MQNRINGRRAFIIIIVLAVLGTLAMIAVQMVATSELSSDLGQQYKIMARTRLLATSGIQYSKAKFRAIYTSPDKYLNTDHVDDSGFFNLNIAERGKDCTNWSYRDTSGAIDVNDGIKAGEMEIGPTYQANMIDPWPGGSEDTSGLLNLRIRRLLNAYGDVHKFAADLGWPTFLSVDPVSNNGQPFTFSSTAVGNRFTSQPPRNAARNAILDPMQSTGLGDRIIGNRPNNGYLTKDELRAVVDSWATDVIGTANLTAYLGNQTFFDSISADLTLGGWQDKSFYRLRNEIGVDLDGDGNTDYPNDFTNSKIVDAGGQRLYRRMEIDAPDLRDLWEPHSVSVINANAASAAVRAAIFYSPVNPSYTAEGAEQWMKNKYVGGGWSITSSYAYGIVDDIHTAPLLGVAGPVFDSTKMTENGYPGGGYLGNDPYYEHVQINRLMSLRDAMRVSLAYNHLGQVEGFGDSFERFAQTLKRIRLLTHPLERAENAYDNQLDIDTLIGVQNFDQQYLEASLPHFLSTQRRLPAWLHAPIALISPYVQDEGDQYVNYPDAAAMPEPPWYDPDTMGGPWPPAWLPPPANPPYPAADALRSAEDFVWRFTMPKVTFSPTGIWEFRSTARLIEGSTTYRKSIVNRIRAFETVILRTQKQFMEHIDPATDSRIQIGPEPASVTPSPFLGVVGLKDRVHIIPGGGTHAVRLDFDGDFKAHASSNFRPRDTTNAMDDPYLNVDGLIGSVYPQLDLRNSNLEGTGTSIFHYEPGGQGAAAGSDLSVFGGAAFSARDHGLGTAGVFNDSLYFRPQIDILGAGTGTVSEAVKQGFISMWVRMPTGYQLPCRNNVAFDMTFFDKTVVGHGDRNPLVWNQMAIVQRPVHFRGGFITLPRNFYSSKQQGRAQDYYVSYTTGAGTYLLDNDPAYHDHDDYSAIPDPQLISSPGGSVDMVRWNTNADNILGAATHRVWPGNPKRTMLRNDGATFGWGGPTLYYKQVVDEERHTTTRYSQRPGSWTRILFRWDFRSLDSADGQAIKAISQEQTTYINPNSGSAQPWQPRSYNPKMSISIGEEQYWSTVKGRSMMIGMFPKPTVTGAMNIPTDNVFSPARRLDSLVDNVIIQFGGFPDESGFAAGTSANSLHAQINSNSGGPALLTNFESIRYDLAGNPKLVLTPPIPDGALLFHVGARIYDVPFQYDHTASVSGESWDDPNTKAPRVDLGVMHNSVNASLITSSDAVVLGAIVARSHAWNTYCVTADSTTRIELSWINEDTHGRSLENTLTDIPWVEDIRWHYVPPQGPAFEAWVER